VEGETPGWRQALMQLRTAVEGVEGVTRLSPAPMF
jgi:hypothetical protein